MLVCRSSEEETECANKTTAHSQSASRKEQQVANTENNNTRFEIRSPSGQLLCTVAVFGAIISNKMNERHPQPQRIHDKGALRIENRERALQRPPTSEHRQPPQAQSAAKLDVTKQGVQAGTEDGSMTDAQKRLLFRIMSDQGFEGDKAYEQLKKFFQVGSLKEVTKLVASHAIDRLLAQGKGGSNGDRSSVQ